MLNQQSFLKRRNILLAKMTATKQQWSFYFVLKLLYCKDKRVSILLMPIRQICWTLANLPGTVGHFRLLHCRLLRLPLNVSVSFIHFLRSHAFLSSPNGVCCTEQSCHNPAVLGYGIFRPLTSTTSACVYLHFHSSLLRPRSIL